MTIQLRCEQCNATFDPLAGGICASCGRMLCGRHLRGLFGMLLPTLGTGKVVCVDCRKGREPKRAMPGSDG